MNKSLSFSSRRRGLRLVLSAILAFLMVPRGAALSASQDPKTTPSPAVSSSPADTAAQTEAQKKAAERKKRFEEQKNLLDGGGSAGAGAEKHAPARDTEFWIDPIGLNMMATESQEVHVFDWRYNDVSARVSWSLSNSEIADMTVKGIATITAKMPGTVSVIGTIDGHTVEAIVTVYRGEKLPWGTPRTVSARPPINHGYTIRRRTGMPGPR
jgi:hypothetical protein